MIGYLEGIVFSVESDHLILQVNGVGYEVSATAQTLGDAQSLVGEKLPLWIYSHIREDAFQLFGFIMKSEKDFFTQLLKVNGIGPKSALTVMNGAPVVQIQSWIEAGDAKALSSLPKIGKKTAEQIVLTLQGKLVLIEAKTKTASKHIQRSDSQKKIASALVNLGFKSQIVEEFISTVDEKSSVEEGVRMGLQRLSGQV